MNSLLSPIVTAVREVWGLFVEDASFTIGIVVCVIVAIFALPHLNIPVEWRGPLFFVALAVVLIENVRRTARK